MKKTPAPPPPAASEELPKAQTLSPEQAKILLAANRRNVVKKLSAGKTLGAREIAELEKIESSGQPGSGSVTGDIAAGMSQAAAILGTSRAVVREAKKLGCLAFRANNNVHVPTLKKWLADHKIELDESEPKHVAESRYLKAKADRMEMIVREKNGSVMPMEVVRRVFTTSIMAAKTRMLAIPDNLCQRLAAIDEPIAIRELLRKAIHEAMAELSKSPYADPESVAEQKPPT